MVPVVLIITVLAVLPPALLTATQSAEQSILVFGVPALLVQTRWTAPGSAVRGDTSVVDKAGLESRVNAATTVAVMCFNIALSRFIIIGCSRECRQRCRSPAPVREWFPPAFANRRSDPSAKSVLRD
jgi:hypothetical protein